MCGICGVVYTDPGRPVDPELLDRMTATLRHRGPDGRGVHLGPGIGLGVQRLGIVDLHTGDQPLGNEDGTVTVVCNGEIYNAPELRAGLEAAGHRFRGRSDVEVLPHLYEDRGLDFLGRLRGMFGLALWDARERLLVLARDRLGIKPLHYAQTTSALYFASELKAILAADAVDRALDATALGELLAFGFVRAPRTLLAPIRRLQPGEVLLFRGGGVSRRRYWTLGFRAGASPPRPAGAWAEELRAVLEAAVRLHLRSDVPVGAFLSTGIDSSAIVALARARSGAPLPTFSLTFEDPRDDEVGRRRTLDRFPGHAASNERVLCSATALARYPEAIWHEEDPTATGLEVPLFLLAEAAARRVKVVLTGEGSDEAFGGYAWFLLDRWLQRLGRLPLVVRWLLAPPPVRWWKPRAALLLDPPAMTLRRYRRLMGWLPVDALSTLTEDLRARAAAGLAEVEDEGSTDAAGASAPPGEWDAFDRLQHYETTVRLPNMITHTLDRATMAHGVEARVPFLDHEVVEFCARIPPGLKLRGATEKYVLRRALRGVLPAEVRRRRKRGLGAPYGRWLRERLPAFAEELLSAGRLRDTGYFDPAPVRARLEAHRAGRAGHADVLMAVLAIQVWDELFRRGRPFIAS